MFANFLRKESMIRVLLIAVILINATIPTVALAKPLNDDLENQIARVKETRSKPFIENNHQYTNLERPISRVSEDSQPSEISKVIIHDADISCYTSQCSDPGPAVVLAEEFSASNPPGMYYFRIDCPAAPCASRDIYWHVSVDFTVMNGWPSPPTTTFHSYVEPWGHTGYWHYTLSENRVIREYCTEHTYGAPAATCHLEAFGVIPGEIIRGAPVATGILESPYLLRMIPGKVQQYLREHSKFPTIKV